MLTTTTTIGGVSMAYVQQLKAQQERHARLIDAMPASVLCQGHVRGSLPTLCVVCGHEDAWHRINDQLIAIFDGRVS